MYGSIFRMKVKPGQEQVIVDVFKQWESEAKPQMPGGPWRILAKAR